MKKQLVVLTLAGLALASAAPALAKDKGGNEGIKLGIKNFLNIDSKQFVVFGTINAVGSDNNIIIDVKADANVSNITNGKVTVKTDGNTKFVNEGKKITLIDLKAGQVVVIRGATDGSVLTATSVNLVGVKSEDKEKNKDNQAEHSKSKNKAVGAVTAVTANSITVTNSLTGTSQTITTDANTKVNIDGEHKTVADVQVGDKGWIKIRHIGATIVAKFVHLFR